MMQSQKSELVLGVRQILRVDYEYVAVSRRIYESRARPCVLIGAAAWQAPPLQLPRGRGRGDDGFGARWAPGPITPIQLVHLINPNARPLGNCRYLWVGRPRYMTAQPAASPLCHALWYFLSF